MSGQGRRGIGGSVVGLGPLLVSMGHGRRLGGCSSLLVTSQYSIQTLRESTVFVVGSDAKQAL